MMKNSSKATKEVSKFQKVSSEWLEKMKERVKFLLSIAVNIPLWIKFGRYCWNYFTLDLSDLQGKLVRKGHSVKLAELLVKHYKIFYCARKYGFRVIPASELIEVQKLYKTLEGYDKFILDMNGEIDIKDKVHRYKKITERGSYKRRLQTTNRILAFHWQELLTEDNVSLKQFHRDGLHMNSEVFICFQGHPIFR